MVEFVPGPMVNYDAQLKLPAMLDFIAAAASSSSSSSSSSSGLHGKTTSGVEESDQDTETWTRDGRPMVYANNGRKMYVEADIARRHPHSFFGVQARLAFNAKDTGTKDSLNARPVEVNMSPDNFDAIVQYARNGCLTLPPTAMQRDRLDEDATLFMLPGLVARLRGATTAPPAVGSSSSSSSSSCTPNLKTPPPAVGSVDQPKKEGPSSVVDNRLMDMVGFAPSICSGYTDPKSECEIRRNADVTILADDWVARAALSRGADVSVFLETQMMDMFPNPIVSASSSSSSSTMHKTTISPAATGVSDANAGMAWRPVPRVGEYDRIAAQKLPTIQEWSPILLDDTTMSSLSSTVHGPRIVDTHARADANWIIRSMGVLDNVKLFRDFGLVAVGKCVLDVVALQPLRLELTTAKDCNRRSPVLPLSGVTAVQRVLDRFGIDAGADDHDSACSGNVAAAKTDCGYSSDGCDEEEKDDSRPKLQSAILRELAFVHATDLVVNNTHSTTKEGGFAGSQSATSKMLTLVVVDGAMRPARVLSALAALHAHLSLGASSGDTVRVLRSKWHVYMLPPSPMPIVRVSLQVYKSSAHAALAEPVDAYAVVWRWNTGLGRMQFAGLPRAARTISRGYNTIDPTRMGWMYEQALTSAVTSGIPLAVKPGNAALLNRLSNATWVSTPLSALNGMDRFLRLFQSGTGTRSRIDGSMYAIIDHLVQRSQNRYRSCGDVDNGAFMALAATSCIVGQTLYDAIAPKSDATTAFEREPFEILMEPPSFARDRSDLLRMTSLEAADTAWYDAKTDPFGVHPVYRTQVIGAEKEENAGALAALDKVEWNQALAAARRMRYEVLDRLLEKSSRAFYGWQNDSAFSSAVASVSALTSTATASPTMISSKQDDSIQSNLPLPTHIALVLAGGNICAPALLDSIETSCCRNKSREGRH